MGEFDLNLSTRPFSSYRVANAGLIAALAILIVLSAGQVYGYLHYSRMSGRIRGDVRNATVESEALRRQREALELKINRPESKARLDEVGYLNALIVRRNFSWTVLFSRLERLMPDSVHLMSLHPELTSEGEVKLHIDVTGRTVPDVKEFFDALQASPAFGTVTLAYTDEKQGAAAALTDVDAEITVGYFPEKDTH